MKKYVLINLLIVIIILFNTCNKSTDQLNPNFRFVMDTLKDGTLKVVGAVINEKKNGLWLIYEGNKLSEAKTFVNGMETGPTIWYFDDEKTILASGYLINGKRNGEWKYFYHNSKRTVSEISHYLNGKLTGVYEKYLEDGRLNVIKEIKNDKEIIIVDHHLMPPPLKSNNSIPYDPNNKAEVNLKKRSLFR